MLPSHEISAVAVTSAYLAPDDVDEGELESVELGGVALNDASQGRMVQTWRAWIDGDSIKCAPQPADTPVTTLVSGAGALTSVSIAFDSAMQPTVCYVEDGVLKLRWYDTLTAAFRTDSFVGATSGKVATDDKREFMEGGSDVIFAFTREDSLYWCEQRDRYSVERLVGAAPNGLILRRIGLTVGNRFQFELGYAT